MGSPSSRAENRFLALLKTPAGRPIVIAHRGDSAHAPENTLEAARLGYESGADAWEFDVLSTRDGVPILMHDESLLRTTDVAIRFAGDPRGRDGFRVSDFDLDEIRTLDAGSWFVEDNGGRRSAREFGTLERIDPAECAYFRSGDIRIPTLEEALNYTRQVGWLANVEIKSCPDHPPGLIQRALEVIAATGTADRVLLSSFDHDHVAATRHEDRVHGIGILLASPIHRLADYAALLVGADTVHLSTNVLGADSVAYRRNRELTSLRYEILRGLQERDLPALIYTVNHHVDGMLGEHLAELGVAGIFTDDPGCRLAIAHRAA